MSGRVLLRQGSGVHDVFEVVELTEAGARVRSPFLLELGEEISVRVEQNGASRDATARVVAHSGPVDAKVTELELVS